MLKYKIYFSNKIYDSDFIKQHSRKLLWFEISKMLIAVLKDKFIVSSGAASVVERGAIDEIRTDIKCSTNHLRQLKLLCRNRIEC